MVNLEFIGQLFRILSSRDVQILDGQFYYYLIFAQTILLQ